MYVCMLFIMLSAESNPSQKKLRDLTNEVKSLKEEKSVLSKSYDTRLNAQQEELRTCQDQLDHQQSNYSLPFDYIYLLSDQLGVIKGGYKGYSDYSTRIHIYIYIYV